MKFETNHIRYHRRSRAFVLTLAISASLARATALDIQLPLETGVFKQDTGAEFANGQCLICHSVEYVLTQPPMARPFWKSSVQKMQQKFGAPITDAQIEPLVDYLTRNYGVTTNAGPGEAVKGPEPAPTSAQTAKLDANQIAAKYGCLLCHNTPAKIGPAYRDVALKYKNDSEAISKIEHQIHNGGSGKWGTIAMPPFPQVTPEELKLLTDWIMGSK